MYPILFEPFGFPISTFGVMMALGFMAAAWITSLRLAEEGADPDFAYTALLYCMIGGILGSKLYYAVDVSLRTGAPFSALFFAREGITWYGGFLGGTVAGYVGCRLHGVSALTFANAVCIGAAVGQALGRVGCFLVGDDYGVVTDLPWGIAFPQGAPPTLDRVHPTQLYECFWLLSFAGLLWRRRHVSPFLFGEYLMLNGLGRFFIEMLRLNEPLLGLTEPQWIAIGLMVSGASGWLYLRGRAKPAVA